MKKSALAALCVVCLQGGFACGTTDSDPIVGDGAGAGAGGTSGGSAPAGGKAGSAGGSGKGGMAGSSGSAGGKGGRGGSAGNATSGGDSGGSSGEDGSGDSGATGTAGEPNLAGAPGTGGSSGDGGSSGQIGASGDGGAGPTECTPVHPNVDGEERTCNAGFCYCPDNDGCFEASVASSCCDVPVVCEADAMNPVATINHPGDNETRAANEDIPFIGVATDPQDGELSGASLIWTSSIMSSPVGTGTTFDAALPPGTHVITLTAIDSDSNIGTDSITLFIE